MLRSKYDSYYFSHSKDFCVVTLIPYLIKTNISGVLNWTERIF